MPARIAEQQSEQLSRLLASEAAGKVAQSAAAAALRKELPKALAPHILQVCPACGRSQMGIHSILSSALPSLAQASIGACVELHMHRRVSKVSRCALHGEAGTGAAGHARHCTPHGCGVASVFPVRDCMCVG